MDSVLKKLQHVQLEILEVIDRFCKEHEISYSLYSGTLLGAVRHGGFIPWDDDVDICMKRSEYERFLTEWTNNPPAGFILQNKDNTPSFTQSFSKIRKEHTTFLQYEWEARKYHTGIFIDIFPLDRIPDGHFSLLLYQVCVALYLLLTREFIPEKAGVPMRAASWMVLRFIRGKRRVELRKLLEKQLTQYDSIESLKLVGFDTIQGLNQKYPADMMDHIIQKDFDGQLFLCCKAWDAQLISLYGDYMTLPPEEERTWKHHPIILDFDRDYEELSAVE